MVSVVATKSFEYDGKLVHAGEAVTMKPIDAAVAGRRGDVTLYAGVRPTYQTRDMTATAQATPVTSAESSDALPKTRRRRSGRRSGRQPKQGA